MDNCHGFVWKNHITFKKKKKSYDGTQWLSKFHCEWETKIEKSKIEMAK